MTVSRPVAAALLAAVGALLIAWSLVVPIFEAPDEPAHWQYARYLHDHQSLPFYERGFEEANSPPLYYLLIAPLARESSLPSMVLVPDAHGQPVSLAPPRLFYDTDRDLGRYGPIRLARLASAALSVVTVWLCALAGRAATGRWTTGLLAAAIVALLPQFAFRGATVSNDALLATLSAATTLGMTRIAREGFTPGRGLWTACALAAAYLSKISAIALAVPFALVLASEPGPIRRRLTRSSVLALAGAIVLPWSIRNVLLYGDPFASRAMRTAVAHLITDRSLLSWYFVTDFPLHLAMSSIGIFGWANLLLPAWVYLTYAVLAALSAAGLVTAWRGGTLDRRLAAMLAVTCVATLAVVVHINLSITQPQGRYLFPGLPAAAVLAAIGFESLPAWKSGPGRPAALVTALAALNLYALAFVVWPAYHPPMAHDLAPGVRTIWLAATSGFAHVPRSRDFVVTGEDPWWIVPLDEDADRYPSVEIRLSATLAPPARRGCLYFATAAADLAGNEPRCFEWMADGTDQTVNLSMQGHPGWAGRVTHLRLDVLDDERPPAPGARVRLDSWLLRAAPPGG